MDAASSTLESEYFTTSLFTIKVSALPEYLHFGIYYYFLLVSVSACSQISKWNSKSEIFRQVGIFRKVNH